ncbi:Hypp6213 [Branchiostoma lanceolatum]|uniref:Hypp6213 protein n=1 Tax=Branchiostoma lanceolatum TaxID=7740 RepID=A0A8J9YSE8_BRALA|nr:Hypp6213 [Branchiostoma lanceolatum]
MGEENENAERDIAVGSIVVVAYEDDWAVGEVTELENSERFSVNFMERTRKKEGTVPAEVATAELEKEKELLLGQLKRVKLGHGQEVTEEELKKARLEASQGPRRHPIPGILLYGPQARTVGAKIAAKLGSADIKLQQLRDNAALKDAHSLARSAPHNAVLCCDDITVTVVTAHVTPTIESETAMSLHLGL